MKDYYKIYNTSLKKIIHKTWWRELLLFGYDYKQDNNISIINKDFRVKNKDMIKYLYDKDELYLNKKLVKTEKDIIDFLNSYCK